MAELPNHKRILKWQSHVGVLLELPLHPAAEIILVGRQPDQANDEYSIWTLEQGVDDADRAPAGWSRLFRIVGAGHHVPAHWVHHGSWIAHPYVWHLFEEPR